MSELTNAFPDEFKTLHLDIPWRDIKITRNIVVHRYGSIDNKVLWATITKDIPVLKFQIQQIVNLYEKESQSESNTETEPKGPRP
ncbi:MAG: DUF86 domain-containing protein [Deltaproteobacteria bacterium]|nr:DUF86 domain-containing protein [Deltaproteobacteria bacterium]